MGLASYGTDRYVKEMWKCVAVKEDGGREINFPREEFFDFIRTLKKESVDKDLFQIRADVAFAAQAVLEKSTFLLMEEDVYKRQPIWRSPSRWTGLPDGGAPASSIGRRSPAFT